MCTYKIHARVNFLTSGIKWNEMWQMVSHCKKGLKIAKLAPLVNKPAGRAEVNMVWLQLPHRDLAGMQTLLPEALESIQVK